MKPGRLTLQYNASLEHPDAVSEIFIWINLIKKGCQIIGSKFERDPPDSTLRYTYWANSLTQEQLNQQVLTSHGPTVIMPTWFCSRDLFNRYSDLKLWSAQHINQFHCVNRVGEFDEKGKGTPEDLIFFYRHLDLKGKIFRIDEVLLVYRYHPLQTTFSIDEYV